MTDPTIIPRSAAKAPRNHRLAQALAGVSIGADWQDVYRALLPGPVLVPTAPRGDEPTDMPSLLAVRFPGGQALLGFTSVETLRVWSGRVRSFTVMSGTELSHQARAARAGGIVIDAGSDHEIHLEPFELDQLADGLAPVRPGEIQGQTTHAARRIWPSQDGGPSSLRKQCGPPPVGTGWSRHTFSILRTTTVSRNRWSACGSALANRLTSSTP